jgi:hypothetical protein
MVYRRIYVANWLGKGSCLRQASREMAVVFQSQKTSIRTSPKMRGAAQGRQMRILAGIYLLGFMVAVFWLNLALYGRLHDPAFLNQINDQGIVFSSLWMIVFGFTTTMCWRFR